MDLLTNRLIWLWIAQGQDPHTGVQRDRTNLHNLVIEAFN